ncbi:polyadenylate-binding protein-interacting protein 3-like isoform X3 [Populus nigra]|uniref:polyadenylate-binding protein-interacting protein 3-like isoform X3 n=1 Tax=Populus nigra TaxID=3691 RepID=UPI002B26946E|nr:polyadenylate-binding protein-interacting protein 3-like isoform X3 [Populus nigra]
MSLQQAIQPKSSANGFGRRRTERDWGTRFENKVQSGKAHTNRPSNAGATGKVGVYESPLRDRLVYLTTCLIGHPVEVQLKNGSVYSGTCYTTNAEKEFAIILKMARLIKDVSLRGPKAECVSKAPSKTLILPGKEVVQVIAKDVSVTIDGMSNELQQAKQQEIMIDSFISQSRLVETERELEPWVPDEDEPQCPELENIFDGHWNRGWDQFETNEMLFGVKSTFDEELYTTKLERGPQTKDLEREALRIAREIEGEDTRDLHLAEERGIHLHESFEVDEETRFSSVYRGGAIDDGGHEELDDVVLSSLNGETFGGPSASSIKKSADLTHAKTNVGTRVLSTSSLDEVQCSQSSTCADLHHPGSHDHAAKLASEPPTSLSTSDSESRAQEDRHFEHGELDSIKERVEEKMLTEDAQLSKGKGAMPASSGPGLSPSSSMGSLSSEKSTLNPHAKEFKLNPNAKSFTPSQTPARPPSPMSDGSFYFQPNLSAPPHMHGMPVGVGPGPSFNGQQPVMFNPQVTPLQAPQAYFHPGGPQFGQQMLLGHPRQVLYMPSYQPEMPYKGREF